MTCNYFYILHFIFTFLQFVRRLYVQSHSQVLSLPTNRQTPRRSSGSKRPQEDDGEMEGYMKVYRKYVNES